MRRLFRIVLGFILAVLAASAVQVIFALPPTDLIAMPLDGALARFGTLATLALAVATHAATFAAIFFLVAIVLAEVMRVRAAGYYAFVGLAVALAGFLAQFSSEPVSGPTIVNTYALLAFAAAGMTGGFVYWLVAGRWAGRSDGRSDGPRSGPTTPGRGPGRNRIAIEPEAGAEASPSTSASDRSPSDRPLQNRARRLAVDTTEPSATPAGKEPDGRASIGMTGGGGFDTFSAEAAVPATDATVRRRPLEVA